MSYCNLGLLVSVSCGEALKLIFAASLSVGLKVEEILTSLLFGVSCAKTERLTVKRKTGKMYFFMVLFLGCFMWLLVTGCCYCPTLLFLPSSSFTLFSLA